MSSSNVTAGPDLDEDELDQSPRLVTIEENKLDTILQRCTDLESAMHLLQTKTDKVSKISKILENIWKYFISIST